MTDYIKRDIERIIANAQECDIDALTWEEQKERLKAVKSADVAPVRHRRWIVGDSLPMRDIAGIPAWGNWHTCNQCKFKTYAIEGHITQYKYCPNCGAKMDGENDERV